MSTPHIIPKQQTQSAELVSLREGDLAEIARFIAAQSKRTVEAQEAHLRWFLLENPARNPEDILGFGLRSRDQLVGCILCSPQYFCFGDRRVLLMGSSSFYVDEPFRGHGGRIFLQYCRLANRLPLFGTSANSEAAALWKAAGAKPIPGSEGELFGVLRWPPVAEEFAHRKNPSRLLSRVAGSPVSGLAGIFRPLKIQCDKPDALRAVTSAEEAGKLSARNPAAKLTAMRDSAYIRWRYFSGRDATVAVFAFRSHEPNKEILVTVNQRARGYRGQINTLNLLDVYPEVSSDEWLRIVGALIGRYKKTVDAVVLRNLSQQQENRSCGTGFQRRTFDAPLGWFLDKAKLLPTRDWYPVPADGDALI